MNLSPYIVWFLLTAILVAAELMTGTFYLLMIAIGLTAGGIVALLGGGLSEQVLVSAVISVTGVLLLRSSSLGRLRKSTMKMDEDPCLNLDIGHNVYVLQWDESGHSRVAYRGSQWDVEWIDAQKLQKSSSSVKPEAGTYQIIAVRGNQLIVG